MLSSGHYSLWVLFILSNHVFPFGVFIINWKEAALLVFLHKSSFGFGIFRLLMGLGHDLPVSLEDFAFQVFIHTRSVFFELYSQTILLTCLHMQATSSFA